MVKLQFHLLPIRDWNKDIKQGLKNGIPGLQFHLLPIRDWNYFYSAPEILHTWLQFHLLPIRDWNPKPPWGKYLIFIAISFTPY